MAAPTCRSRSPSNRTAQPQRLSLSVVTTDRRGYYLVMTRTAAIALLALLAVVPSWAQTSGTPSSDRVATAVPAQSSSEKVHENPGNQYILVKTVVGKVIGTIDARALPVEPAGYNLLKYCWTPSNVLGDWAERAG